MMNAISLLLLLLVSHPVTSFAPSTTNSHAVHILKTTESDDDGMSMDAFAARKQELLAEDDFDGYAFRDLLVEKWNAQYDVNFNKVDSFGFKEIYLNIYPFKMGGRNKWRHETELDYLMHLQAVVEILEKYDQLDNVVYQIRETKKTPKMGAPLKAVPIRLELSPEEVNQIMGF